MSITIQNIHKRYGAFEALKDVSLEIATGELVALLGPSGSGKTTLLRMIAGLETPDGGNISLNGLDHTSQSIAKRGIGFVFQHYALFRHMTVFENVAFGLRVQDRSMRPSKDEIRARVQELLHLVQLESYAKMYPVQLSGGQRQRIALARALAVRPGILLLDEPFSALDAKVRKELRDWLRRIHQEMHVTTVLVTHDQEEALEVADRVAILNAGKLEQVGSPQGIYDHPASPFVYRFLGSVNLFRGRLLADLSPEGEVEETGPEANSSIGFVRPHELEISKAPFLNGAAFQTNVIKIYAVGPIVRVEMRSMVDSELVIAEISRNQLEELGLSLGDEIFVRPRKIRLFDESGGGQSLLEYGAGI